MGTWVKIAKAIGSGTADPVKSESAISPVPSIGIANKPAPGQIGPKGLAPRTTYSKVNTGTPPTTAVGLNAKQVPPRGLEFLPRKTAQVKMSTSVISKPSIQELRAAAMEGTMDKVAVAQEANRQHTGVVESEKTASIDERSIPTDVITKLADAMSYLGKLAESGSVQMVGDGPNSLTITETSRNDSMPTPDSQGKAPEKHQIPINPPLQAERNQAGKSNTGLSTNDDAHKAQTPYPTEPIANQKTTMQPPGKGKEAMVQAGLERIARMGRKTASTNPFIDQIRKIAEDRINPAKLSANGSTDPPATATGEGVPSEPSDVNAQKNKMISGNQAAINYTKRDAKADPIKDVEQVVDNPAMSSAHDKTLNMVLTHTDTAKISMVKNAHQIAAARALLVKLAQEEEEKKDEKQDEKKDEKKGKKPYPFAAGKMEKEKEGMMEQAQFKGPNPTPQGSSGFSSSTMSPTT